MYKTFAFLIGLAMLLPSTLRAQSYPTEHITNFRVEAVLESSRRTVVTEMIDYVFNEGPKHGIYRYIPNVYQRKLMSYSLRLNLLRVLMDGKEVPYQTSTGNMFNVRIGDPNTTITGNHRYAITYESEKALNDVDNTVEWYWNLTGNGWNVPIQNVELHVQAPSTPLNYVCYVGYSGETENACEFTQNDDGSLTMRTTRVLDPSEGVTVAVSYPSLAFDKISPVRNFWLMIRDNAWVFLPLLSFLVMFPLWYKRGRDPKGRGTIIPHYEEPAKMPPGLQSALLEQTLSNRAITASLLDMARRGYMKIEWRGKNDVVFYKKKDADEALHEYEKSLYLGIFSPASQEVSSKDLEGEYYESISKARGHVFEELVKLKLMEENPMKSRLLWTFIGVFVGTIGFVWLGFVYEYGFWGVFSGVLSGAIICAFGWQMPKVTKQGAELVEEIKGFEQFLKMTEQERLKFHDAPEKKAEEFSRFLPAAVAFGVERAWAKQFEAMQIPPPDYATSSVAGMSYSSLAIADTMSSISRSTSSFYSPPSSGGSGFSGGSSGGGGGGGGGGSW